MASRFETIANLHALRGLTLSLIMIGGCAARSELEMAQVRGTVTLDGMPLAEGVIVFTKEGEIPREISIVQGRYEGTAYVGMNQIQFAVYRPARRRAFSGPGAEETSLENILPSRYNQESTMGRMVQRGENRFDFALESK